MNGTQRQFEGLLDRYFEETLADHPVWANRAGLRDGEGKLGKASYAHLVRLERRRQRTLVSLDSINPRELEAEQHLDRLALRAMIRQECDEYARKRTELEPAAVGAVLDVLQFELQRGETERARAKRNVLSLLRAAPGFLEEAAMAVVRPERVWCKVMEQTCAGAPALFDAVDAFTREDHSTAAARKAVVAYRDRVMSLAPAPEGSFAIGAVSLQRLVHEQLGLDYSLGEIEALAMAETRRISALLEHACRRFGKGRTAESIIAEARAQWQPGNDLLGLYRKQVQRIAGGFRAARALSFPEAEELEVRLVPPFMRHLFPTAAYSSPGAFEKRQRGIFWVNDLGLAKSAPAERQAERQQHFGVSLTAAHEAYPGHHLQFVTANRHPRQWRRLFAHAVFYEGWTLWCEQMMVDLKIDPSPWVPVQQLHDALWRAHRILVDLRLQTGRYSYAQGVTHLKRHLGFTRTRSEAEINWYSAAPGVPMSYWLGRLENERLRLRLMQGGGWSLRRFNDWLLSFGTLPQSWIEKYGI